MSKQKTDQYGSTRSLDEAYPIDPDAPPLSLNAEQIRKAQQNVSEVMSQIEAAEEAAYQAELNEYNAQFHRYERENPRR